jgi:hypothetical protein
VRALHVRGDADAALVFVAAAATVLDAAITAARRGPAVGRDAIGPAGPDLAYPDAEAGREQIDVVHQHAGLGPEELHIGSSVRISYAAVERWIKRRELEASGAPRPYHERATSSARRGTR